jgi:outer membrane receptor protein involved in Fe transport
VTKSAALRLLLVMSLLPPRSSLHAQGAMDLPIAGPQPHFVAEWAPTSHRAVEDVTVFSSRLSVELVDVPLASAIKEIIGRGNLRIMYSPATLPSGRRVTVRAKDVAVITVLTELLFRSGLDVVADRDGTLALVPCAHRVSPTERESEDSGSITGTVNDAETGRALPGATVVLDTTSLSTTTDDLGRFQFIHVPVGQYLLRVRYIGYDPARTTVGVEPNKGTHVAITLRRSAQHLEEVVTTGTLIPTQVKALPTPVTIVTDSQIALQRPTTVMELFRQTVPTAVSFSPASNPEASVLNVRGASTLLYGLGGMKVFVDGIEVAFDIVAGIDPNIIERIEVIRGPQAAAIYGSDAVGGVVSVFTKRGDATRPGPALYGEAALGLAQTPYPGYGEVTQQGYKGSLQGGGANVTYNLAADYSHLANWLPGGARSARSRYGLSAGMRYTGGIISLDLSGRHNLQDVPQVSNPEFATTGLPQTSRPSYQNARFTNQTVGAQLELSPFPWWTQIVRAGVDRFNNDLNQDRPRLTTPDDTLLSTSNFDRAKTSFGISTSLDGHLTRALTGALSVGFDHYSLADRRFFSFNSLSTSGEVQPGPGSSILAFRIDTRNTGYFAQAQLGYRDALFFTAGLRGEANSEFGDSVATPFSPRIGASYAVRLRGVDLKVRASWGRAIRAPIASSKDERMFPDFRQIANLNLAPERQQGWDTGVDLVFGGHGKLSITYYDQIADNLIQNVQLAVVPLPVFQNQNVGRVKNSGVEIEGSLALGTVQVRAQYGYARSRIDALAPAYTGDMRIGDQAIGTPRHTAGASFTVPVTRRLTVTGGLAYVGSWTDYDYVAQLSCFGGTGPCHDFDFRNFLIAYPDFAKLNTGLVYEIDESVSTFLAIDNLTNNHSFEQSNAYPVIGRVSTAGARFRF